MIKIYSNLYSIATSDVLFKEEFICNLQNMNNYLFIYE